MADLTTTWTKRMREEVEIAMSFLKLELRNELQRQGHVLTGRLANSIEVELKQFSTMIVAELYMLDYYVFVDRRTPASRIPFTPGSGARRSQMIEGLKRFFRLKGLGPKEAERASFATANKWKEQGRPTRASFRFSSNGQRTGFLTDTVDRETVPILDRIEQAVVETTTVSFNSILDGIIREFELFKG